MNHGGYTSPERAAEIMLAKRLRKRMDAKRTKHGRCYLCVHREETFGLFHCRNKPDRNGDNCEATTGAKFKFDDTVLKEFADAA